MARVHADLEAVRVAEMYTSHPLLKHMPVPHFRLPNVELDLPISISGMEQIDSGESGRKQFDPETMGVAFTELLDKVLEENDSDLTEAETAGLKKKLGRLIEDAVNQPYDTRGSLTGVVSDLIEAALEPLRKPERSGGALRGERLENVREELKRRVMVGFLKLQSAPPRLEAEVMTHRVAEGPTDLLARIKMKVSEEGMEWARVENEDGGVEDRLVAE